MYNLKFCIHTNVCYCTYVLVGLSVGRAVLCAAAAPAETAPSLGLAENTGLRVCARVEGSVAKKNRDIANPAIMQAQKQCAKRAATCHLFYGGGK